MPPAPGVTSVEVYGFVGWIASAVAYVLYLLWAYVPDRTLWRHGVTYYPSKYWAVAFPTWVCVSVVAAYWSYKSLNLMSMPPRDQPRSAEAHYGPGGQPDPGACQYFSMPGSSSILPLRVIPQEIVDLVLQEGRSPHGAYTKAAHGSSTEDCAFVSAVGNAGEGRYPQL